MTTSQPSRSPGVTSFSEGCTIAYRNDGANRSISAFQFAISEAGTTSRLGGGGVPPPLCPVLGGEGWGVRGISCSPLPLYSGGEGLGVRGCFLPAGDEDPSPSTPLPGVPGRGEADRRPPSPPAPLPRVLGRGEEDARFSAS